jgi:hypothetical protein
MTSADVIARTGVQALPEYTDLTLITDAPGFAVRRRYPADVELRHVVNNAGEELVRCIVQFVVEPPTSPRGVSRVSLRAWVFPRWKETRPFHGPSEIPPGDPAAPTPDSLQRWREARKPIQVDFVGDFLYDVAEDRFTDTDGRTVGTEYMLDYVYDTHCRTLRRWFVLRWNAGSLARWVAHKSVWRLQDGCFGLLVRLYDVEVTAGEARRSPFHEYRRADFVRSAEATGRPSTFFGFESSRKNLFTNLVGLGVVCWALYGYLPRGGFWSAIYRSDALTTAALVLGFFALDIVGPAILVYAICGLSRVRPLVMFFYRRVRP